MDQLLSITLDGAGPLRSADPHAVLAFLRASAPEDTGPGMGRRAAARFGATLFVLGTIVESGPRMDVRASLYAADGALRASAVGAVMDGGDLAPVVDSLTRQLISALY